MPPRVVTASKPPTSTSGVFGPSSSSDSSSPRNSSVLVGSSGNGREQSTTTPFAGDLLKIRNLCVKNLRQQHATTDGGSGQNSRSGFDAEEDLSLGGLDECLIDKTLMTLRQHHCATVAFIKRLTVSDFSSMGITPGMRFHLLDAIAEVDSSNQKPHKGDDDEVQPHRKFTLIGANHDDNKEVSPPATTLRSHHSNSSGGRKKSAKQSSVSLVRRSVVGTGAHGFDSGDDSGEEKRKPSGAPKPITSMDDFDAFGEHAEESAVAAPAVVDFGSAAQQHPSCKLQGSGSFSKEEETIAVFDTFLPHNNNNVNGNVLAQFTDHDQANVVPHTHQADVLHASRNLGKNPLKDDSDLEDSIMSASFASLIDSYIPVKYPGTKKRNSNAGWGLGEKVNSFKKAPSAAPVGGGGGGGGGGDVSSAIGDRNATVSRDVKNMKEVHWESISGLQPSLKQFLRKMREIREKHKFPVSFERLFQDNRPMPLMEVSDDKAAFGLLLRIPDLSDEDGTSIATITNRVCFMVSIPTKVVVTYHACDDDPFEPFQQEWDKGRFAKSDIDRVAEAMIRRVLRTYSQGLSNIRDVLDEIENEGPDNAGTDDTSKVQRLSALQKKAFVYKRCAAASQEAISALADVPQMLKHEKSLCDSLETVISVADEIASNALSSIDLTIALSEFRSNGNLKIFTYATILLQPVTVATSWYGMNFVNMPELDMEPAYFVFTGAVWCVAICIFTLFVLKDKGVLEAIDPVRTFRVVRHEVKHALWRLGNFLASRCFGRDNYFGAEEVESSDSDDEADKDDGQKGKSTKEEDDGNSYGAAVDADDSVAIEARENAKKGWKALSGAVNVLALGKSLSKPSSTKEEALQSDRAVERRRSTTFTTEGQFDAVFIPRRRSTSKDNSVERPQRQRRRSEIALGD